MVENYCKGGSEYSGILNFQKFDCRTNISEKYKKGHFEPKSDENQNNSESSERQSDDNDIKRKLLIVTITHDKTLSGRN